MTHLVLLGAGHAHLFVLQQLLSTLQKTPDICKVTLISPQRWQFYSGMIPGWIEGIYSIDQCRINIKNLLLGSDIRFVELDAVGIDSDAQTIQLSDASSVHYDLLSIDIGSGVKSIPASDGAQSAYQFMNIKPLARFCDQWHTFIETTAQTKNTAVTLAVIGGGAAGVELAFAANARLKQLGPNNKVTLVTGQLGVLPNFSRMTRWLTHRQLREQSITVLKGHAKSSDKGLMVNDKIQRGVDCVLTATGACALPWLTQTKLQLAEDGYIAVDEYHRSLSHPTVFAAGDTCSRRNSPLKRSGVHAVRAGPILAHNLLSCIKANAASLEGSAGKALPLTLKAFKPRRHSLFLLASGRRHAIGSWGPFTVAGRWVWRWKDSIDQRFIHSFSYDDE